MTRAGACWRRLLGGTYSYCTSSRSIAARVSGATSARPLTTFDTVARDTPAASATVASVARREPLSGVCTRPLSIDYRDAIASFSKGKHRVGDSPVPPLAG